MVVPLVFCCIFQLSDLGTDWKRARRRIKAGPVRAEVAYACEAEAFRKVAAVRPDLAVAQSDCQLYKFFCDRTRVIDLHGLNDTAIAHEPANRPIKWGKYSHSTALRIGAPIWIWGFKWMARRPIAKIPMERLISDRALVRRFAGHREAVTGQAGEKMVRDYVPASLRACGGRAYFNFLVRKEFASQFRAAGIEVGVTN